MLSNPFRKREAPVAVATLPEPEPPAMSYESNEPPPTKPELAPLIRPEPIQVETLDHDALAEYVAVAESIGFSNPALARARLLNFLQREEIPVYDSERVSNFMTALVVREKGGSTFDPFSMRLTGTVWVWRPMLSEESKASWFTYGSFAGGRYQREVPLDVLRTVAKVKGAFPDAKFYVTDYETVKPDPFLCVKLDGCEHVVIAVWDEPDFKLTKKA